MKYFRRKNGLAAFAGLLLALGIGAPKIAAQADIALLQDYLGDWRGRGKLSGANTETVVCKLNLSNGNDTKINYAGRCAIAGTNLSINGTLAYIDEKRRYEAIMTSNAAFTGVAIGRKQGNGVVFNLKEREKDEAKQQDMTITAGIALLNGAIDVEFRVVDEKTGDIITAKVPFAK